MANLKTFVVTLSITVDVDYLDAEHPQAMPARVVVDEIRSNLESVGYVDSVDDIAIHNHIRPR